MALNSNAANMEELRRFWGNETQLIQFETTLNNYYNRRGQVKCTVDTRNNSLKASFPDESGIGAEPVPPSVPHPLPAVAINALHQAPLPDPAPGVPQPLVDAVPPAPAPAPRWIEIDNSDIKHYEELKGQLVESLSQKHSYIACATYFIITVNVVMFTAYISTAEFDVSTVSVVVNFLLTFSIPVMMKVTDNFGIIRYLNHVTPEHPDQNANREDAAQTPAPDNYNIETGNREPLLAEEQQPAAHAASAAKPKAPLLADFHSRDYVALCFVSSLAISTAVEVSIFASLHMRDYFQCALLTVRLWFVVFLVMYSFARYLDELGSSEQRLRFRSRSGEWLLMMFAMC